MKIKNILIVAILFLMSRHFAVAQTAEEWVSYVDRNMVLKSAQYIATMTVHLASGKERTFKMDCKVVGEDYALIEYIEPRRDLGTLYLKRDESLWIYFPRVDKTMQIQGHMLRQGVQGGEMSFEDMSESSAWQEQYDAEIVEENDEEVTILLSSKDMTVSYPFREITVNKKTKLPSRILNSDASKNPIKENNILEYEKVGDRYFPTLTEIRSSIVENKYTRFEMSDIRFDVKFPANTFTKRSLEK